MAARREFRFHPRADAVVPYHRLGHRAAGGVGGPLRNMVGQRRFRGRSRWIRAAETAREFGPV
ncbi:hypothetical protein [Nocardia sp. NPDC004722]